MSDGFVTKTAENGVVYLVCTALEGIAGLAHGFTTRIGGVSEGVFSSLNISPTRGDPADTALNRRLAAEAIGVSDNFCFTKQVHKTLVRYAEGPNDYLSAAECDGLWTDRRGLTLFSVYADCVPILLYGRGRIAAVHAGWRGTAAGILKNALRAMEVDPSEVIAAIGPCIGRCCFMVHKDVASAFDERYPIPQPDGRYSIDLKAVNADMLADMGVREIHICQECTCCDGAKYYSHRRDGDARGLMAAMIALK